MTNQDYAAQALERELNQLISTPMGRRYFLASVPVLLAGCASTPKTRMREGDNSGQAVSLTPAQEKQMANEYIPQMEKEYPPLKDPTSQAYIRDLGNRIVAANKLSGNPYNYEFTLVDAKMVNAFALPA